MSARILKEGMLAAIMCALAAVIIAVSPAFADTVLYSEGFEDDNGGYTGDTGGVEWEWGAPMNVGPAQAHTGTKCWGTNLDGNAPADATGYIISPEITMPELAYDDVIKIRFWGYVDIDAGARARLFVSPNNDTQIPVADFYLNMGESSTEPGRWTLYEFNAPEDYYYYYNELGSRELEFIFYLETGDGGKPGFYIDDIAVTVVKRGEETLTLELNSISSGGGAFSPQASFFVYTWDGANWIMRDGYTTDYGETTPSGDATVNFYLSPYLPDPDGEYKVRIWQDFLCGDPSAGFPNGYAAIDRARFRIGESSGTLDWALDLRYAYDEYPNYESDGNTYPVKEWVTLSDDTRYQIDEHDFFDGDGTILWQDRWSEYAWYGFSLNRPPATAPVWISGFDTINWTYSDPDGDPQSVYEVEIWTQPGASGKNVWDPDVGVGTTGSIRYSGFTLPYGIYYVRVKACDDQGNWSGWSETAWNYGNYPPTADAGPDVTAKEGRPAILDGRGSTDPDDGIASYLWEQIVGTPVTIENANQAVATFTAPLTGPVILPEELFFKLTVTDASGISDSDVCRVYVGNDVPPVADAGADATVMENKEASLNGTGSYDPDGDVVSYLWEQTKGPSATIADPSAATTTFIAPLYDGENNMLEFRLTVTDDGELTGEDTCQVTILDNMPPAMPLQTGPEDGSIFAGGEPVTLTSGPYADPEDDAHMMTSWMIRRVDRPTYDYSYTSPLELDEYVATELPEGLQYAWKVGYEDIGSQSYSWSGEEMTFTVGTPVVDTSVKVPTGWGIRDYLMVSFTTWPEDPAATSIFGVAPNTARIRIGTYDPTRGGAGGYIEYGTPDLFIKPGTSYWFLVRGGFNPAIDGVPVSLEEDIDVPLLYNSENGNGWNMIGTPNNADYRWNDVEVLAYDSAGEIIAGPIRIGDLSSENTMIDKRLWRWESGAYYSDTTEMERHSGYWLKARKANVWLRFPADAHLAAKGVAEFYTSLMMKEASRMAKAWGITPAYAAADTSDMPPMPMGAFADTGSGQSPLANESKGGCFIGTAR